MKQVRHSLASRFVLFLAGLLVLAMTALLLIERVVFQPVLMKAENQQAGQGLARIENSLTQSHNALTAQTRDWAHWDDTYQFIQDANSDYATSNFSREKFEDQHDQAMIFISEGQQPMWIAGIDPGTNTYGTCTSATGDCSWAAPLIAEVQPFLGEVEASGLAYEPEMPTSVLMLDIDHFKLYNDRYGHPEGDRCLASVAECMEQTVKPHGFLVARTGGEEFSVLMPETGLEQARTCAGELRKAIAGLKLPHADSPVSDVVTVSVGVASSVNVDNVSGSTLMRSADLALYEAKDQGRNRVACFGEDAANIFG